MSTVRRLAKGDVFRAGGTLAVDDGNTQFAQSTQNAAGGNNNNTSNTLFSAAGVGATGAASRRPRVHIPEAVMEDAVLMASEGKVSTKNAWDVKVIEGMESTVASSLTDAGVDEYLTFTRMANVVESGAKVWTHRVDNTYQLSLQMVRRVLRTEAKGDGEKEGAEGAEGEEGAGGGAIAAAKAKRRRTERTIADSVDELNVEGSKGDNDKISDTISPLFRAITKRYEQGHSKGLLMNNAPVGLCANMILDVDYSKAGRSRQQVAAESETIDHTSAIVRIEPVDDGAASPSGRNTRKSVLQRQEQALIASMITSVVPQEDIVGGPNNSAMTPSRAQSQQRASSLAAYDAAAAASSQDSAGRGDVPVGYRAGSLAHRHDDDDDNDNGDWGTVDDYGDDGGADGADGAAMGSMGSMGGVGGIAGGGVGGGGGGGAMVGDGSMLMGMETPADMARRIANGSYELARMERALASAVLGAAGGRAEDSWIDFSQDASDALAKQRNFLFSKSLGNIRKQSIAVDNAPTDEQKALTQQAKKKARADKKIVTFITEEELVDESAIREAMKLNATNATALTPLGKELLGYSASTTSLEQYGRDYHFCDARSRSHHFTLPSMRREELPWWLPLESGNVRSFYQPFCTESAQWGSLRKTRALQSAAAAAAAGGVGGARDVIAYDDEGRIIDEYTNDMPADVFEAGGDDYDDGGMDDYDDGVDLAGASAAAGGGYGSADLRQSGLFSIPLPYGIDDEDALDADNAAMLNAADDLAAAEGGGGTEGGGADNIKLMDAPQMIEVLKVKTATVPTSVDVVKLREIMWRRVQELANFDPNTGKASSSTAAAAAVVGRKRQREEGSDDDDDDEGGLLAHINDARFSDVITAMLPDVKYVTRDGALSPAFFFFAILFLANEHRIILENDPDDVADLFITKRIGAGVARDL